VNLQTQFSAAEQGVDSRRSNRGRGRSASYTVRSGLDPDSCQQGAMGMIVEVVVERLGAGAPWWKRVFETRWPEMSRPTLVLFSAFVVIRILGHYTHITWCFQSQW